MAWETDLVEYLRYRINDIDASTYTNAQLQKFITYAAYEVFPQIGVAHAYTVTPSVPSISPDPSTDIGLSALLVLKAAIIIVSAEYKRLSVTAGYKVTDDRSSIDGTNSIASTKDLLKTLQDLYDRAFTAYQMGDGSIGRAVLGPYTYGS